MSFTLGNQVENIDGLLGLDSIRGRLKALVRRPWLLFSLVLLANAVFRPYHGLFHDACLYGLQALNHAEGNFANDLYLRYGSQDSYSMFSSLAQPLVSLLGIRVAFFLAYLLANGFFFFALQRLTLRLVKSASLAVVSLLLVAVLPVWFGGLNVFHANENFFTPRILANGLVLLGCEQILARRMGWALLSIIAAMMLHPLMSFAGLLVWLGVTIFDRCSLRVALAIAAGCASGVLALLLIRPIGVGLLGEMDAEWREAVKCGNYYAFLSEWLANDWLRIGGALGCVLAASMASPDRRTKRFLGTLTLIGLAGVVGSWLANRLPYAFLFQGQPYRTLWLLQLLAIPVGLQLAHQLWNVRKVSYQLAAVGIIFSLAFSSMATAIWATAFVCLAFVGCSLLLGQAAEAEMPETQSRLISWAATCGFFVLSLPSAVSTAALVIAKVKMARDFVMPLYGYRAMFQLLGPGLAVLLAIGLTLALLALLGKYRRAAAALLVAVVAIQVTFYGAQSTFTHDLPMYNDVIFVKDVLPSDRHLSIHWPYPTPRFVWFDLEADNFFSWQQTAGSMFNRQTAMEAQRRAQLVASFDLHAFDAAAWTSGDWELKSLLQLYAADGLKAVPTLAELKRLCEEPGLDYVLSRHRFPALYEATNGRWYIYNCAYVRESFAANDRFATFHDEHLSGYLQPPDNLEIVETASLAWSDCAVLHD